MMMKMANKTFYLVMFDEAYNKDVIHAMPSILDEESAKVMMQPENQIVQRKKGGKFRVTGKRMFEYTNTDGSKTLFIIADVIR